MKLILLPLLGLSAFARRGRPSNTSGEKHCTSKKRATEQYGQGYSLFKEIQCNADGTYKPIQKYADDARDEGVPDVYVCVAPHSGMVRFELGRDKYSRACLHEDFKEEILFPTQASKDEKPCDYAKYRVIVRYEEAEKVGRMISDLSSPQCLDNGLYKPLQYSSMGASCVSSADGAYIGMPSKDENGEDYCPGGEDKCDDVYSEGGDCDEGDDKDDKCDDVYSEGGDCDKDYDEDDVQKCDYDENDVYSEGGDCDKGDDQDDVLEPPTGNMQCNLGIDVVLVLDEATNFDGLEEIIRRVFWDKTDTITIVQLENNCDKIKLYGKHLDRSKGEEVLNVLKGSSDSRNQKQIPSFKTLESTCSGREALFLWNHNQLIRYISQGRDYVDLRCMITGQDLETPGNLHIRSKLNFQKVDSYEAAQNFVCRKSAWFAEPVTNQEIAEFVEDSLAFLEEDNEVSASDKDELDRLRTRQQTYDTFIETLKAIL